MAYDPPLPGAAPEESPSLRFGTLEEEENSDWTTTVNNIGTPEDPTSYGRRTREGVSQWTSPDGSTIFVPAGEVSEKLPYGAYVIRENAAWGLYFENIQVKTGDLIDFPQTNIERVFYESRKFWERELYFRKYGIPYKRGLILWGPPGCGKSCCIRLIVNDVIERKGVVINMDNPHLFIGGYRVFRQIQPDTPLVVILEDIDSLLEDWSESAILNILDGVEKIDKVLFIATTNYPEKLGPRIINRPSRFDKRFKISLPNVESRKIYLTFLNERAEFGEIDKWVKDTDGFTLAHLQELFIAVNILGDEYKEAIRTLKLMKSNKLASFDDDNPSEIEDEHTSHGQYV